MTAACAGLEQAIFELLLVHPYLKSTSRAVVFAERKAMNNI